MKAYPPAHESLRVAFPEAVKRGGHAPKRSETCTFTPMNSPRVLNLHFVQILQITIRWFTPPLLVLDAPAPLKAATCTNAYDCGGNMPASMPMRGFASARVVREPSPQTSPTARFYQCRDRRLAPCCAVCAHEGANERLRAAAGTSARAPWAHSRRRASDEASHPPRSPLALLRLRMP